MSPVNQYQPPAVMHTQPAVFPCPVCPLMRDVTQYPCAKAATTQHPGDLPLGGLTARHLRPGTALCTALSWASTWATRKLAGSAHPLSKSPDHETWSFSSGGAPGGAELTCSSRQAVGQGIGATQVSHGRSQTPSNVTDYPLQKLCVGVHG